MAITDHSHYLREGSSSAQWREIEALNEKLAPFRILRGIEANIRANGEVDVDDEHARASFDWVVASLHQASTRTRPSGSSARWSTRTSTASAT